MREKADVAWVSARREFAARQCVQPREDSLNRTNAPRRASARGKRKKQKVPQNQLEDRPALAGKVARTIFHVHLVPPS
jgi:hypothetical protein